MSIYRRGKIWWIRKDPVTGVRRSTQCRDKKAALLYEGERERIAASPAYAASYEATIGHWADKVNEAKLEEKAAGTANMYRVKLGHVVRIFGADCPLVDLTPPNVDVFIKTRRSEGAANNTISKELTALMQLAKLAKRAGQFDGQLDVLKPSGFKVGYVPRKRALSVAEVDRILGKLPPHRAAAFALALATGARHSELGRITTDHVDRVNWIVHVPGTKTIDSNRKVPVVLPQQRRLLELALPFLPVKWPRMSKDLPELCERLEILPVTANDLRRTFSTWLIEAGADRSDVARLMGHRGTQMLFKVYGQESADALGRNIAKSTGGTQASQYAPDGSECAGGPELRTACDSCLVAPVGVEPTRPEGPRILSPKSAEPYTGITWLFRCNLLGSVAPDSAYSRDVGTPSSQFRELSRAWFGDVGGAP